MNSLLICINKVQSKCLPPNTNRLALFLYLGMFNIISVINLCFWSESTSWHFEGSCIFYSWNGNVRACHISLLPLSMVLVKHVISARACKGCVHVLAHDSVCFCVRVHTNVWHKHNLTSRGPLATAVQEHMAAHDGTAWTLLLKCTGSQQQPRFWSTANIECFWVCSANSRKNNNVHSTCRLWHFQGIILQKCMQPTAILHTWKGEKKAITNSYSDLTVSSV